MFRITLKMMRKNLRMLIPAGIAILIGSAFISATFLFGNALNASLAGNVTASYGDANYVISVPPGGYSDELPAMDIDAIEATDGVEGLRVDTASAFSVKAGSKSSTGTTLPASTPTSLMPVTIAEGEWPDAAGEIALTAKAADRLELDIGDAVTVPTGVPDEETGKPASLDETVVGLTDDPNGAYSYSGGAFVLNEADFYELLGTTAAEAQSTATTAYLLVDTTDPAALRTTTESIEGILGDNYRLQTREASTAQRIEDIGQGQNIVTTFLLIFGVIAMLVAALVIANTFQVLVAQRRRTLALLRTIGAKKGQLYRSVIIEATILGTAAAVLGVGLANILMWVMSLSGLEFLTGSPLVFSVDWRVFVVPILFGLVMTVLASLGSARTATNVTPLEALRPMDMVPHKKSSVVRALLSLVAIAGGLALAVFSVIQVQSFSQESSTDADFTVNLGMAVLGGALLFVGLILSALWWMPVLMRGAGALVGKVSPAGRIASANVAKNPRRVAATGVALLIGVTLVTAISTGAASAKETLGTTLSDKYTVDVQVDGADLDSSVAIAIADVEGIDDTALLKTAEGYAQPPYAPASADHTYMTVYEISQADRQKVMRTKIAPVEPGTVVMNATLPSGEPNPLKDGETVTLPITRGAEDVGSLTLTVSLQTYDTVNWNPITALIDPGELEKNGLESTQMSIWAKVGETSSSVQTMSDLQDAVADFPDVSVSGAFATRAMWETSVNAVMAVLIGLLAVSVVIALIGVANTLSLSVIERTRESATLRAIGMTRRQLRVSLGLESLIISVVAGLAGLVMGIAFGWLGSTVVLWTIGTPVFRVDAGMAVGVMVIAIVAALISSIAPARRAVKTPPVEALAEA